MKLKYIVVALLLSTILFGCGVQKIEPCVNGSMNIVVLPDTQYYSEQYPHIFLNQTRWINQNAKALDISFVIHLGDMVQHWDNEAEWDNAKKAMAQLIESKIPYGVVAGNHDHLNYSKYTDAPYLRKTINVTRAQEKGYNFEQFGLSSIQVIEHGGDEFAFLGLDFCPSTETIDWAKNAISVRNNSKVIIFTHGYLDVKGNRQAYSCGSTEYIWDELIYPNNNVIAVFCGHAHGEFVRVDKNAAGDNVYQILSDYQTMAQGGAGFLRIYGICKEGGNAKTYSPYFNEYLQDEDSQFDMRW